MNKIYLFISLSLLAQFGLSQFVKMPLNYTNDNTLHTPNVVSIVDENTVWIATQRQNPLSFFPMPYSIAKRTTDGEITWQSYTIPIAGNPYMTDVEAVDNNICYYFFEDLNGTGSSIWKTIDGGSTWSNKTTNQFINSWGDFLIHFGQDTLVAVGDPTNEYFEIQISNDRGATWSRVPAANIPPILNGEGGVSGKTYSRIGNTIWFGSSIGRCFKSVDKGLHWTVSVVGPPGSFADMWTVCFYDLMHGIFYCKNGIPSQYYITSDGGETWTKVYFLQHLFLPGISRIDGISEGLIICARDTTTGLKTYIYYTTDFFTTMTPIDTVQLSTNYIYFKDSEIGWLSGKYRPDSNIYKFTGVLTALLEKRVKPDQLSVNPNPANGEALVTFPSALLGQRKTIRIYDLTGKIVEEYVYDPGVQSIHLNSSKYSNGVYSIALISDNKIVGNTRWVIFH
jgi:photosystem II stability/assembly factor-like uncharacterized protein